MSATSAKGALLATLVLGIGAAGGYWFAQQSMNHESAVTQGLPQASKADERKVLYWYDPMVPQQKFDQPGKSPFMDMQLVPRYADEGGDSAVVSIDASITQNLGMRLAPVTRGALANSLEATGSLTFNTRDIAVVQARTGGFVERVYARAPEDLLEAGAPLADLLVPEWVRTQEEYLALRDAGDPALLAAARQRLRLAGMPAALITRFERSGKVQALWTVTSPIAGVLQQLDVREGMNLMAGDTLATINGLRSVWLDVAVPEAQILGLHPGQVVEARLPAFPGEVLGGSIEAILPQANLDSRTLRVRVVLDNPDGRLRPGLTAQVRLARSAELDALFVPSEAVIRSGRRALVMLAEGEGRYRPLEVRLGQEAAGNTQILEGLQEGQQVVASGQFLLDSEASLRGIPVQELGAPAAEVKLESALHEAEGQIDSIEDDGVMLTHGPFKTLGMPGMSMLFPIVDAALLEGFKPGDRVRVGVRADDEGMRIERIERLAPVAEENQSHDDHREAQP
ncbi:efflux RND transporter periplasmic adaptor subunit [Pseudomonas xionganensis]|uniref:Efflux RND transporter periplasmic adaptor subunit n=1 Tax=Pseudomonas xionganensis TaxID=2654845 RepID=A0A6I4KWJ3_9PSED|nr:efflux RND transporter periplasmic adaptor subunit [Pseudomonas xionganensis]MVW76437.1 efflux RND transporter periplasmic adaptor subunit [Pseudomonas xionganensis]